MQLPTGDPNALAARALVNVLLAEEPANKAERTVPIVGKGDRPPNQRPNRTVAPPRGNVRLASTFAKEMKTEEPEMMLPEGIRNKAVMSGREWGWRRGNIQAVIAAAKDVGCGRQSESVVKVAV